MLFGVWNETDYSFDMCKITNGACIVYAVHVSLLCIAYFSWNKFLKA
jgi:hypothetical protein